MQYLIEKMLEGKTRDQLLDLLVESLTAQDKEGNTLLMDLLNSRISSELKVAAGMVETICNIVEIEFNKREVANYVNEHGFTDKSNKALLVDK